MSSPSSTSRIWLFSLLAIEKLSRNFRFFTSLGRVSPALRLNMLNFTLRTRPRASGCCFTKASLASQRVTLLQLRMLSLVSKVAMLLIFWLIMMIESESPARLSSILGAAACRTVSTTSSVSLPSASTSLSSAFCGTRCTLATRSAGTMFMFQRILNLTLRGRAFRSSSMPRLVFLSLSSFFELRSQPSRSLS